jgi:uncharacterized glyoxalase superfamily protein PhnB
MRIAADLRDLPEEDFKAQLKQDAQDPRGTIHHAKIRIGDRSSRWAKRTDRISRPRFILYVPDAEAVYHRALEAVAMSIDEPVDHGYGDRYAGVKDPFGNVWYIATHLRDFTIPAEPPAPEVAPHQCPAPSWRSCYNDDVVRAFELYQPNQAQQQMPLLIAALHPKMLELAATQTDGTHPYFVPPEHRAKVWAQIGPTPWICVEQAVILEADATRARAAARQHMSFYATHLPNCRSNLKALGGQDRVPGRFV